MTCSEDVDMKIEYVIHANDRTKYIEEAIKSAALSNANLKEYLIVSCNSKSDRINLNIANLAEKFGLKYRRSFSDGALGHFRESVNKCEKPFICLLHDDDYVGDSFFQENYRLINTHPQGAAFGVDTIFDIEGTLHHSAISISKDFRLSPINLTILYLLGRCGPAFPSVVYRTEFIRPVIRQSNLFGKYSDASILLEAAKQGFWISPRKEFSYRMHAENDSKTTDPINRKLLHNYLFRFLLSALHRHTSYLSFYDNLKYFVGRFIKHRKMAT